MAIGSAEFEKGKPFPALGDRILEFLAMNSDKAYMEAEIGVEMMQADGGDPVLQALTIVGRQAVVLAVLDNLVRDGKIVSRIQHKMPYYMLASQLGSESTGTKPPTR